ncbi:MAG TPA: hypothetical protein EYP62_07110 [Kiritimatiellae bacterium]|nr:hypothetical protein [Kiritimatiellia bacterium]
MGRIVSIHEYELRPGVDPAEFERDVLRYWEAGRPRVPGLEDRWLLKGIKGHRRRRYAAVWIYRDRASWEAVWGPPHRPVEGRSYPPEWIAWEEFIGRFLDRDPDRIVFSAYEVCRRACLDGAPPGGAVVS